MTPTGPPNPIDRDRERLRELLREMNKIVNRLAAAPKNQGWVRVSEAALLLDVRPGRISHLVESGALEDDGGTRHDRHISLTSIRQYKARRKRPQRDSEESAEVVRRKLREAGLG